MRRTQTLTAPVVTFLSSSPALSRRAQVAMQSMFGLKATCAHDDVEGSFRWNDSIDSHFQSHLLPQFMCKRWDSISSQCPVTGTVVHFLSLTNETPATASPQQNRSKKQLLQLLAVIEGTKDVKSTSQLIQASRDAISERLESFSQCAHIAVKQLTGQTILPADVLGNASGTPLLKITNESSLAPASGTTQNSGNPTLREIAIPFSIDASHGSSSSSISSILSSSPLERPVVGMYKFNNGFHIRPLPAAAQDRVLPAPSLVFQCQNAYATHTDILQRHDKEQTRSAKIGFSGTSKRGQWIVAHEYLSGLDLRLDDSTKVSSCFSEAQEALLAGSLQELQNVNVLLEGGEARQEKAQKDVRTGYGDCWVEFRANLKQPSGFVSTVTNTFNRNAKVKNGNKVSKMTDLPFE